MPKMSETGEALRIVVTGAAGRMGRALVRAVSDADGLVLSGATALVGDECVGLDAGLQAGTTEARVTIHDSLEKALDSRPRPDVVIDFTHPDASLEHARICAERGVALVVGSTGFSAGSKAEMAGRAQRIPIVMAPNMAVGVNVLFRMAGEVAKVLGDDYDVEIVETHHRLKKDAPSGTALRLCESVADALGLDPETDVITERNGFIGERPHRKIGMQTLRGGDVVGDHTVFFFGNGERVELTHRASSRSNFADGAVRASRWIVNQEPGLYDMLDVLGLSQPRARE